MEAGVAIWCKVLRQRDHLHVTKAEQTISSYKVAHLGDVGDCAI